MDEYKECDLNPCPWCGEPVHVEFDSTIGYMVTCGNYYCNCPEKIFWPSEREAIYRWNSGATQWLIDKKPGAEPGPNDYFTRKWRET